MNDNSSSFSSLSLFRSSIKKIARKETDQSILNNDINNSTKGKALFLKKADLNVQNVLSTILNNCDDEEKNNFNINGTLKQIQNVKRNIPILDSNSSADDSDLSPVTRKNKQSINQMIESPKSLWRNLGLGRIKNSTKSSNKHISENNNPIIDKKGSLNELNPSKICVDKEKIRQVGNFLYKQNERAGAGANEEDDDDNIVVNSKFMINSRSIRSLNKLKEEIHDSMNLSPHKSKESIKELTLHKTEYVEDKSNCKDGNTDSNNYSPVSSADDDDDSQFHVCRIEASPFRCLTRRNNLYDSLSEEEESQDEYYYIEPNNPFIFVFDTVLMILSLLSFLHLPFAIAFIHNSSRVILIFNFVFNTVIDFLYFADIIIVFFTAYYDLEEHFIIKNKDLFLHYLKGWFAIDFIAALPFNFLLDYILVFYSNYQLTQSTLKIYSNDTYTLVHLFRLLRLFKCFKIIFHNSFMNYLKTLIFDSLLESKWALINISLLLFFAAVNLFGCIFVFIGFNHYPNWFEVKGIEPHDKFDIYITSIYFILMTIVSIGYGDITAANMIEKVFNVFLLIFGIMLYSWAISAISNQIEDNNEKAIEYKANLKLLEQIKLSHKGFPQLLNEKIKRYLYHNFQHEQCNVENILDQLPWILRNALIYNMYRPILENFIFFKNFSNNDFCVRVLMAFKPIVYLKNERIIHDGDYLEEMLFVKKGMLILELLIPSALNEELDKTLTHVLTSTINPFDIESKKILSVFSQRNTAKLMKEKAKQLKTGYDEKYAKLIYIRANEHFGDIMMFLNQRCPLSVRVKTRKAEVYLLKKTDAIDISMSFPKIWRTIIRKSIFNFEQINCLIRKTLRFFFLQNQACYNQLMKKFQNFSQSTNYPVSQFNHLDNNNNNKYDASNYKFELASIPTLNSDSSIDRTQKEDSSAHNRNLNNINPSGTITGMMKLDDDGGNYKATENSTANLISHSNDEQQNDTFAKKNSYIKNDTKQLFTIISENDSIKNNSLNKSSDSSIKNTNSQQDRNKFETQYNTSTVKCDDIPNFNFTLVNTKRTHNSQDINNELYDNESLHRFDRYAYNSIIDWDNFYDKTLIKEIFNQKPENEVLNQFKSVPAFGTLKIDQGEYYEYKQKAKININTTSDDERSMKSNNIKFSINLISTNFEEKKDSIQIPLSIPFLDNNNNDKNILKWNNTNNGNRTTKEETNGCISSRSNKSPRSSRSILSQRSIRSNRSGKSGRSDISNSKDSLKQQFYTENEGIERIFTAKNTTVDIFRKKGRKATMKESQMNNKTKSDTNILEVNSILGTNNNSVTNTNLMRSNTSLLQVIGENIHSNAMNLNNPSSFYSSTFANMIDMHKTKTDLLQIDKKMNNLLSLIQQNE